MRRHLIRERSCVSSRSRGREGKTAEELRGQEGELVSTPPLPTAVLESSLERRRVTLEQKSWLGKGQDSATLGDVCWLAGEPSRRERSFACLSRKWTRRSLPIEENQPPQESSRRSQPRILWVRAGARRQQDHGPRATEPLRRKSFPAAPSHPSPTPAGGRRIHFRLLAKPTT